MKVTKSQLKQIIKEELDDLIEGPESLSLQMLRQQIARRRKQRARHLDTYGAPPLSSYKDEEEEPEELEPEPSAEPEPEPEWLRRRREEAEAKALADERSQTIGAEKKLSRARHKAQKRVDMGVETEEDRTLLGLQEAVLRKILERLK